MWLNKRYTYIYVAEWLNWAIRRGSVNGTPIYMLQNTNGSIQPFCNIYIRVSFIEPHMCGSVNGTPIYMLRNTHIYMLQNALLNAQSFNHKCVYHKWVSFAKEPYKRDKILQKRPMIVRSLRTNDWINAHPVSQPHICSWIQELCGWILVSETYEWLNWAICPSHVCGSSNDTCLYICGMTHAEWLKCHIYVAE